VDVLAGRLTTASVAAHFKELNGWRPTAHNMKLEQQVCSLDLAKRLKELGVKQESVFWWASFERKDNPGVYPNGLSIEPEWTINNYDGGSFGRYQYVKHFSAFTVAELGEMLPAQLHIEPSVEHPVHQFVMEKQFSQWHAAYICAGCMGKVGSQVADTEADARAKMLCYLLENKLLA
jgi:hypothetical protein